MCVQVAKQAGDHYFIDNLNERVTELGGQSCWIND